MGDCQNYGPFLGPHYNTGPNTGPNLGDPKRDHNFDNLPYDYPSFQSSFLLLSRCRSTRKTKSESLPWLCLSKASSKCS